MPDLARSSLSEVNRKLAEISYSILNVFDNKRWKNQKQVIYSTVSDWDTAYEAYLVYNKTDNVKFPFAALTRDPTQETYKLWNKPFTAYENLIEGETSVNAVRVKPVRVNYILTIYDQRLEDIEALADIFILEGQNTYRFDYESSVLGQPARVSFTIGEPVHEMIPDKAEKRSGKGFVYGLNITIVVDSVLGIKVEAKIIEQALFNVLTRIPEPLPDEIQDEDDTESEIITDQD